MKEMQDLYIENFKTLLREIKESLNSGELLCLGVGRLNIFNTAVFPNWFIDMSQFQSESQ